jgi:hypothetical protein
LTCVDAAGVARIPASEFRKTLNLLGSVPSEPSVPSHLTTDCRAMSTKYLSDVGNGETGFQESGNLVTFVLTEMFVSHRAYWQVKEAEIFE